MANRKTKPTEKQLDKIQDRLEKIELKSIQKDYETQTPFFVWLFKVGLILAIPINLILLFAQSQTAFTIIQKLVFTGFFCFTLYGMIKRKKWAWYLWLMWPVLYLVSDVIYKETVYLPAEIIIAILVILIVLWHKDYFTK